MKYLLNCFWLLLPILAWNIIFFEKLPKPFNTEAFDQNIPTIILLSEQVLRGAIMILPIIMVLSLETRIQKYGLFIYSIGLVIYFASWLVLIKAPESTWSQSMLGFTAPAYTTLIWLVGIGLIGKESFFKIDRISVIYMACAMLFVVVHTLHTVLAFQRN